MVQHADPATRATLIDALMGSMGNVIANNRTLDGLAEWMEVVVMQRHITTDIFNSSLMNSKSDVTSR